jgi:hypothetical protein
MNPYEKHTASMMLEMGHLLEDVLLAITLNRLLRVDQSTLTDSTRLAMIYDTFNAVRKEVNDYAAEYAPHIHPDNPLPMDMPLRPGGGTTT